MNDFAGKKVVQIPKFLKYYNAFRGAQTLILFLRNTKWYK